MEVVDIMKNPGTHFTCFTSTKVQTLKQVLNLPALLVHKYKKNIDTGTQLPGLLVQEYKH